MSCSLSKADENSGRKTPTLKSRFGGANLPPGSRCLDFLAQMNLGTRAMAATGTVAGTLMA